MSTNYYFRLKGIKNNVTFPSCSSNLINMIQNKMDIIFEGICEIHIGKRAGGYKPLFQKTEYFKSVADIRKFYSENKDCLTIVDEYNTELTFPELEEELISWCKGNRNARNNCGEEYFYTDDEGYNFNEMDFS